MSKPIVIIIGTRPDAIKLVPVYKALKKENIPVLLCATNQHRELLDQVLEMFDVQPDVCLNIMKENQDLGYITTAVLTKTQALYAQVNPRAVMVQGDTTSSFAAALSAFYENIPIAHVEAGLRTHNIYAPFPEEANRLFISRISTLHFAATAHNVATLLHEDVAADKIFCVGNTVIDTLNQTCAKLRDEQLTVTPTLKELVTDCKQNNKRMVLFTMHRRESFKAGARQVLDTIVQYAQHHPDLFFIFPVHPNPHIRDLAGQSGITNLANVFCTTPVMYSDLIYLLEAVDLIITDSGGIQEEAVTLGKPMIIIREVTERVEVIWEGMATLVGTDPEAIRNALHTWYTNQFDYAPRFVYGDGKAAERIAIIMNRYFSST